VTRTQISRICADCAQLLTRKTHHDSQDRKLAAKRPDRPLAHQTIKAGAETILFISGRTTTTRSAGHLTLGQARTTTLKAQVEAGGGTLANIVKLSTFLVDIRHRTELAAIREEFFGKRAPASTLVGVTALALPGWLIEVEAIAVI
jgi:enamine deaminase RidA (YjgF/YER057c/UK114 family)